MLPWLHSRQNTALMLDVKEYELTMGISLFPQMLKNTVQKGIPLLTNKVKASSLQAFWECFPNAGAERIYVVGSE
jgi:hypothetical protein